MRSDRVLVSMKPYLGDAVMAQPSIDALASAGSDVYLLSSESAMRLLAPAADPDHRITFSSSKSLASNLREAKRLRGYRFGVAVLVNLSFRSALMCRLAGIPRRVGHAREGRNFLLTDRIAYKSTDFQASSISKLLEPLKIEVPDVRPRLRVDVSEARTTDLLAGATVGFHPGSRDVWKQIPVDTVIWVLEELRARGHTLAMFGGKEEAQVGRAICEWVKDGVVDLIGRTTIEEVAACLAQLKASFGGDTGVMHISAAMGCPTVQVFGSDRADRWGHAYAPHRVLRAPGNELKNVSGKEILNAVLHALG